jgi:hypothetical protein
VVNCARRWLFAAALLGGAAGPVACGSFGATEPPAQSSTDASAEGAAQEDGAAPSDDGGRDGGGQKCPVVFTESFATGEIPPMDWTKSLPVNATTAVVTSDAGGAGSPGVNAFEAIVTLADDAGTGQVTIERSDPRVPAEADLTFWMATTQADLYAEHGCQLRIEEENSNPYVASRVMFKALAGKLDVDVTSFGFDPGAPDPSAQITTLPVPDWGRYDLDATIDSQQHTATVVATFYMNAGTAFSKTLGPFPVPQTANRVRIKCGIDTAAKGPGTFGVQIDNVSYRACP